MNDLLSRALAAQQPDSEQLQQAIQLLKQDIPGKDKQQRLQQLADQAPQHEQSHFNDLFDSLARAQLNGR
jgi:hypothetical protein